MITIILYRKKCIGCSYCEINSPLFFKISKKDGKTILLNSFKKKKFYILKNIDNFFLKNLIKTSKTCPLKIINIQKKLKN
ncbi:MAG: ferredoxin [Candidatus Shikimatogenerans bostrichidophilus]|nr:MAG: ferredoxin [Candidatus Shikimatogenerans bostrichidophilus]